MVVHEGETVEPAGRREHFEVFGLDLPGTVEPGSVVQTPSAITREAFPEFRETH